MVTEAEAEKQQGDNRTMGRKHTVPYGLYRAHGFIPAFLAGQTGFGEDGKRNTSTPAAPETRPAPLCGDSDHAKNVAPLAIDQRVRKAVDRQHAQAHVAAAHDEHAFATETGRQGPEGCLV